MRRWTGIPSLIAVVAALLLASPAAGVTYADIEVQVSQPDPVVRGTSYTATVFVRNNGPGTATNVSLHTSWGVEADHLSTLPTAGLCTSPGASRELTCSLSSLPSGGYFYVYIQFQPTAVRKTFTVVADGSSADTDVVPGNDLDLAVTHILAHMVSADYDGDGADDIGVFRNGMWFISYSPDFVGVDLTVPFGSSTPGTDIPQIGETSCVPNPPNSLPDARSDLVVLRKSSSTWLSTNSPDYGSGVDYSYTIGTPSHKRLPTRWLDLDWNGCTGFGLFKNGCFTISDPGAPGVLNNCFGLGTDEPLGANLDKDGEADLILWRAASSHYSYRTSVSGYASDFGADLGAGEVPLLGDLNGDGMIDLGSYKKQFSTFRFTVSPDFQGVDVVLTHGVNGDIPIVADVNGDGIADIGIFRNSVARWWFLCSPTWTSSCVSTSFGVAGDIPIYGKPPGIP